MSKERTLVSTRLLLYSGGSSANFWGGCTAARELKICLNAARSAAVPAKNYEFCALVRAFCFFGNKRLDFDVNLAKLDEK